MTLTEHIVNNFSTLCSVILAGLGVVQADAVGDALSKIGVTLSEEQMKQAVEQAGGNASKITYQSKSGGLMKHFSPPNLFLLNRYV